MYEIGQKFTNLNSDEIRNIALWCNAQGDCHLFSDDSVNFEIRKNEPVSKSILLRHERRELESKLKQLDYIGVKIATGRATADEYAEQIALMSQYANRINEIDSILTKNNKEYNA